MTEVTPIFDLQTVLHLLILAGALLAGLTLSVLQVLPAIERVAGMAFAVTKNFLARLRPRQKESSYIMLPHYIFKMH